MDKYRREAAFLYEVGTMRKLTRIHRQVLLTDDMSDSISSHSYRVAIISWFLAKEENADLYKTVMMSLLHDMGEARSNDHNWVHKRYVKIFEEEIDKEQMGTLPFDDFKKLIDEYQVRKTKEAILAKDADSIDQLLLLREYMWQGNKEAAIWLRGKSGVSKTSYAKLIKSKAGKKLAAAIYKENPSDWWNDLWSPSRKK